MFVTQPTASCTVVQAGVKPGGQQGNEALGLQSSKFSTTETFTTTHGFVIAAPQAGWTATPNSQHNSKDNSSSHASSVPLAPEASSTPVGWSGLLEISRATGGPGVVGSVAASGDFDLDEQGHLEVCCTAHTNTGVRSLVKSVVRGLKARQEPEAAREGMGGTYFFANEAGRKCAIFKPCDEEPLAPANPKGYVGRNLGDPGWKSTVRVGEAAMREVAAYLLDYDHFAQVPHTVLVQAQHPLFNYNYKEPASNSTGLGAVRSSASVSSMATSEPPSAAADDGGWPQQQQQQLVRLGSGGRPLKLGSLQEFVYHIADTNEMGASRFRARDVHAIGMLDIRLFNTDRHAGNILVREPVSAPRDFSSARTNMRTKSLLNPAAAAAAMASVNQYELIPIDHGFCLPEALEAPYFEWLHWPQACLPFDEEELAYIAKLDVASDIALLQRELPNLRPECLRVLEVATTLLQRCAAAGLTLADIGALASRPLDALDGDDSCPSELEKACVAARQAVETRELTAMMSSSSCSSSGDDTYAFREEDEEGLSSSELDSELVEEVDCSAPQQVLQGQQSRPRAPSRLAVMGSWDMDGFAMDDSAATAVPAAAGAVAAVKAGSNALTSVMSEGTVYNLTTAMSLGSIPARAPGDADLLFDLDDDGSPRSTPASSNSDSVLQPQQQGVAGNLASEQDDVMAGASPPVKMEAEQLTQYLSGAQLLPPATPAAAAVATATRQGLSVSIGTPPLGLPPLPPTPLGILPSPAGAPPVARSVHMGENWMLQGLKAKAAAAQAHCTVGSSKKTSAAAAAARRRSGVMGVQRFMYPPPVVRAAPRKSNEVLSGLSEEQWAAFMAELSAYMNDALKPEIGSWRRASEAAGFGGAAMSCPRF